MKFCGACGTRNEDNAVRCVNCGSFFNDMVSSPNSNNYQGRNESFNDGFNNYNNTDRYNNNNSYSGSPNNNYPINNSGNFAANNGGNNSSLYPENNGNSSVEYPPVQNQGIRSAKDLFTEIVKFVVIVIVAAALLGGGLAVYEFTGYRATINYFEIYFDEYKYEKIVDMYSDAIFYNSDPDNNYSQLDKDTEQKMEKLFDDELGTQDYSLKFKTIYNSIMTDDEYNDFMNDLEFPDKDDVIYDARIVEIKITASANGEKSSQNIKLILTLEDDQWRVYSFDEC